MEYGGFDFFINERLSQYIYLEGMALLILTFSAGLYAKERALYTGKLIKNLLSPLSIALCVRLFWMIVFESRHLRHFAMNMPHLKIEYIVLISIPLFTAILILILRRNLIGYRLGFIAGLSHFVLVCLMVIMKRNPGFGPIIVSLASLAICIFSVKGMREYYFTNKLRDSKVAYAIMRTVLKLRRNPVKIRNILELAGVKEGMKILDYGCGIGSYAIEAAKIAGESGIVIAADRDDKMLQEVDRKTGKYGLSNIHVLQGTSPKDIKDKSFHFIFFIDALQFFKDQVGIINRLLEKLSPQGKLLIKFEHFRNDQIASLLDGCSCSGSKAIYKKYWLLTK